MAAAKRPTILLRMSLNPCPKCAQPMGDGEKFCSACGYAAVAGPGERTDVRKSIGQKYARQTYQGKMRSGRTTNLVVAILRPVGLVGLYFVISSARDKNAREIAAAKGNPAFDQEAVAEAEREMASSRGLFLLIMGVQGSLAVSFYGLWWWAKHRPLPATLSALILFIAVQFIGAALEPESIGRGLIVKILIVIALVGAVNAAQKYQKLQPQRA